MHSFHNVFCCFTFVLLQTWTHSLHVQSGINNDDDDDYVDDSLYNRIHRLSYKSEYTDPICEVGLKSVKSRIQIKCASGQSQTPSKLLSHTLVGLNKITCFPYYDKEMENKLSKLTRYNEEHKGVNSQFIVHNKNNPPDITQSDCFIDDGNGHSHTAAYWSFLKQLQIKPISTKHIQSDYSSQLIDNFSEVLVINLDWLKSCTFSKKLAVISDSGRIPCNIFD
ncbi:unnamed protein product [Schistosoma curassoni]|uniref:Secreted protein n=1 Tax=Schistosoma curassoni TaxID=6186 RepID=A0A183KZR2_9TREM|nr:unnamed protein product [Schistosoma curassoni]